MSGGTREMKELREPEGRAGERKGIKELREKVSSGRFRPQGF